MSEVFSPLVPEIPPRYSFLNGVGGLDDATIGELTPDISTARQVLVSHLPADEFAQASGEVAGVALYIGAIRGMQAQPHPPSDKLIYSTLANALNRHSENSTARLLLSTLRQISGIRRGRELPDNFKFPLPSI